MQTYLNSSGHPIKVHCGNCRHFKERTNQEKTGYCTLLPLLFAYTMKETVFAMVKKHYLCDKHILANVERMQTVSSPIEVTVHTQSAIYASSPATTDDCNT